ncbi:MAG TPA: hypothetical protein VJC20_04695 [Candidatus Paceibacterota bacterium]
MSNRHAHHPYGRRPNRTAGTGKIAIGGFASGKENFINLTA